MVILCMLFVQCVRVILAQNHKLLSSEGLAMIVL